MNIADTHWYDCRLLHYDPRERGETRGRGLRAQHHVPRGQLPPQAGLRHLLPQRQGHTCSSDMRAMFDNVWQCCRVGIGVTPTGIFTVYKEGVFSEYCAILSKIIKHCFHACCQCCLLLLTNVLLQQINKDTGPYTMWVKVDGDLHHIFRAPIPGRRKYCNGMMETASAICCYPKHSETKLQNCWVMKVFQPVCTFRKIFYIYSIWFIPNHHIM